MDLFAILFVALISLMFGIILTICVQYYVFYVYLRKSPRASSFTHKKSLDYNLPNAIKKQLEAGDVAGDKSKSGLAVSLILQFLFHELRHSETIKRWLYKKLSMEFDELLTKTTMGKCFDSISIKDMHLGSQFPDIKDITVENVKLDKKEEHIEVLSLGLNLDYTGNFLLCIDAKMKFSKTAYLSIKVKKICGSVRLQFSRQPYTHWSFAFHTEPILDLAVESHFQGRQLQANITNLIVNQIKKAIKRKHTLPNYKIRYKPFFVKTDPSQLDMEENEMSLQGTLKMNVSEVSRLSYPETVQNVYLTIAVDSIPWISLYQKDESMIMTLEITMTKLKQTQLGVIFRQETALVVVDSVASNSPAHQAGLRPSDVVISVENKLVSTVTQVAKYMKSVAGTNVTLQVERSVENYITKWKLFPEEKEPNTVTGLEGKCEDSETELTQIEQESFVIIENVKKDERKPRSPKMMPSNENMAKLAQTISSFSLRKRKGAGASPSTPRSNSKAATPLKKNSVCDLPEIVRTEADTMECEQIFSQIEVFKGKELPADDVLPFDDDFRFLAKDGAKYINVNAWGTSTNCPDILLGYLNVPINHVASECSSSVLGHHSRRYSFLPPGVTSTATAHPLRAHSGFEHVFCFGDALLTFAWTPTENVELPRKISVTMDTKTELSGFLPRNKHDFVRTQFHGTTHCDFCSKKIWLKDAVQCRQCTMCCHKKCVAKCQTSNGCTSDRPPQTRTSEVSLNDVILQTEGSLEDVDSLDNGSLKRNTLAVSGKAVRTAISKRTVEGIVLFDKRLGALHYANLKKKDEFMRASALAHIQKFPKMASLFCRKSTSKEYLHPDLNVKQMFNLYQEESLEQPKCSYHTYPRVFESLNLSFHHSRKDQCSLCLSYREGSPAFSSRSLPPSPQRTPSRKQSLVAITNPFLLCSTALDEVQKNPAEAYETVSKLLEQVMQCPSDETLMDNAKESGQKMYANLSVEEKKEKINLMMAELKKTLDLSTAEHMDLTKKLGSEESEVEKAKLAFMIGQADAKVHALSVLMLHYCSGLQYTQEKIV
ncbi:unnamed protein product [Ceutorhynchus assimilis]|nr:unnamed protein product [Ceutorhynchus assimilis]